MRAPKRTVSLLLAAALLLALAACGGKNTDNTQQSQPTQQDQPAASDDNGQASGTRTIIDGNNRQVEIPQTVERIVCVGVGALRDSG